MAAQRTRSTLILLALVAASCSYVPPRFADNAPVLTTADDAPIPVPRPRKGFSSDDVSDAYLRHAIVDALEPERTPEAADINALDEVPAGSWFRPQDPRRESPPVSPRPPLAILPASEATGAAGALPVADALGRRWLLRRDPADRPEMRTASDAIASRLVRALGYLTPEVLVVDLALTDFAAPAPALAFLRPGPPPRRGAYRVAATRWPTGIDLGPTPASSPRRDDPNDRVHHHDRRTLRALRIVAAWLRLPRLDPELLRDVYIGARGRGHVEHYLVGLHGALGADAVVLASDTADAAQDRDGPLRRLITLGLSPELDPAPTQTRWPSLGEIGPTVTVRDMSPSPPFVPFKHALPGDDYWAAKRIASLPRGVLTAAVDAGRLSDPAARAWLRDVLEARRAQLALHAYGRVTPCEVEGLDRGALLLRDLAVAQGLASAAATRYLVEHLASSGGAIAPPAVLPATSALVRVELPAAALASSSYHVVRVRAERGGDPAPRAVEVHLRRSGPEGAWRVRGIRH